MTLQLLLPVLPILLAACLLLVLMGRSLRRQAPPPQPPRLWYHVHGPKEISGE